MIVLVCVCVYVCVRMLVCVCVRVRVCAHARTAPCWRCYISTQQIIKKKVMAKQSNSIPKLTFLKLFTDTGHNVCGNYGHYWDVCGNYGQYWDDHNIILVVIYLFLDK